MSVPSNSQDKLAGFYFYALKNDIYNTLREDFFRKCHILSAIATVFFGLVSIISVYAFFSRSDDTAILFSFIALTVGILSYILDFTKRAERHKILSDRWDGLIERLDDQRATHTKIKISDYNQIVKDYNKIVRAQRRIIMYKGLDAIAYNLASRSENYGDILNIPLRVHLFKNFLRFSNTEFRKAS